MEVHSGVAAGGEPSSTLPAESDVPGLSVVSAPMVWLSLSLPVHCLPRQAGSLSTPAHRPHGSWNWEALSQEQVSGYMISLGAILFSLLCLSLGSRLWGRFPGVPLQEGPRCQAPPPSPPLRVLLPLGRGPGELRSWLQGQLTQSTHTPHLGSVWAGAEGGLCSPPLPQRRGSSL